MISWFALKIFRPLHHGAFPCSRSLQTIHRVHNYPCDPHAQRVVSRCPKWGFYLRDFILQIMERSSHIPRKMTRKISNVCWGQIQSWCSNMSCHTPIRESLADSLTLMILFQDNIINKKVAEASRIPALSYGQLVLGISKEDLSQMIFTDWHAQRH